MLRQLRLRAPAARPPLARLRRPPDGRLRVVAGTEDPVDLLYAEASRVELSRRLKAKPLQHLPMLLVSWIGEHLTQTLIPPHAPAILGCAGAPASRDRLREQFERVAVAWLDGREVAAVERDNE